MMMANWLSHFPSKMTLVCMRALLYYSENPVLVLDVLIFESKAL